MLQKAFILAMLLTLLLVSACAGKTAVSGRSDGVNHSLSTETELFKF